MPVNGILTRWDYVVIGFFFVFMTGMGWVFSKFAKNQSDYFRGGGSMLWWLVGATAFMTQFSAWTFTGAAGKAYKDGFLVASIFVGNALGFFLNYAVSAARFRRLRVMTSFEAVRERFGHANEQVFTWLQIPIGVLYGGIWLNGLAVVASQFFGLPMTETILVTGIAVVVASVAGGSWAAIASDFIQMLLLMAISIVAAVLALGHPDVGGLGGFMRQVPVGHLNWLDGADARFVLPWVFTAFVVQSFKLNNVAESYRYLCAKDDRNARRSALLASVLMLVGPAIWFIPPMAARIVEPDIASVFPGLTNPEEGSYVLMGMKTMPVGMLGLLACGIFAATMSSMDSALNRNAGIFIRSFYHPILRKNADDGELLKVGKIASLAAGVITIVVALYLKSLESLSLFEIMTLFGSLVAIPYAMPLVWGVIVRKAPSWAGWSTVLVGFCFSLLSKYVLTPEMLGFGELQGREKSDFLYVVAGFGNVVVCSLWFFATTLFGEDSDPKRREAVEAFFAKLKRPIAPEESEERRPDYTQARILGRLSAVYGAFILLLVIIIPNDVGGRIAFLACAAIVGGVGLALMQVARRGTRKT